MGIIRFRGMGSTYWGAVTEEMKNLVKQIATINRFHHLRLPQISCSEGKAVQVASMFLGGVGGSGGGGGGVISFS